MNIVKKVNLLLSILVAALLSAGCSAQQSSKAESNLICAFVEGYLDDKGFALSSAAEGGSAEDWVIFSTGNLSSAIQENTQAEVIYNKYLQALTIWSRKIDKSIKLKNESQISIAAKELEIRIDEIAPMCENLGWKFKQGWR
jgi:hypothetical protein